MTTVLVTGATGFIVSHLILALIDEGYSVRGTARSASKADQVNRILSDNAGKPVEIELVSADLMHDKGWADWICSFTGDVPTAETIGMLARKVLSSSRHADSRCLVRAVLRLLALSKPQS